MKIKSIAAICKKNKYVVLFDKYSENGETVLQYIGDGAAVYPVVGLPPLDKESVLTIDQLDNDVRPARSRARLENQTDADGVHRAARKRGQQKVVRRDRQRVEHVDEQGSQRRRRERGRKKAEAERLDQLKKKPFLKYAKGYCFSENYAIFCTGKSAFICDKAFN